MTTKLKAKHDMMIEVVTSYDEVNDHASTEDVYLVRDEVIEIDIENEAEETYDGQFGDGSMVYGLNKNSFIKE